MKEFEGTFMTSFRMSTRVFLLGTAVFLGGFLFSLVITSDTVSSPQSRPAQTELKVIPQEGSIHSTFTAVAAMVRPAVVFIKTERGRGRRSQDSSGPFDFFRDMTPDDNNRRPRQSGGGSGFIIDREGRVLTNEHVIRDAERITVVVGEAPDDEEYRARLIGFDAHTDIAVIQIDADGDLPTVALGDSDEMMIGDWVMAIGTPFGQLAGSVTVGVVSATGRNNLRILGGTADYQDYIQTDASINFGNSGGPLVNLRGEAIGINTAINPSGQGIGFAIPINMVRRVSEQLIANGRVRYGYMGIRLKELDTTTAQGLDLDIERGILVEEVMDGSPADEAGLRRRDVIIEFDSQQVRDDQRFRLLVGNTEVGKEVSLKVVRDGREKDLNITLTERRPPEEVVASVPERDTWLGIEVDDVTNADVRRRYSIDRDQTGVVVIDVQTGSPADEAGIQEGDIITEVYSRSVESLEDYVGVSKELESRKQPIAFLVKRGRTSTYIPVIPDND